MVGKEKYSPRHPDAKHRNAKKEERYPQLSCPERLFRFHCILFSSLSLIEMQYKEYGCAGEEGKLGEYIPVAGVEGFFEIERTRMNRARGKAFSPNLEVALYVAVSIDKTSDAGIAAARHRDPIFHTPENSVSQVLLGLR